MTKQELREYVKMNAEIRRLEDKIMEIDSKLQSAKTPTLTGMPKGGLMTDIVDKISDLNELREMYWRQWHKQMQKRIRIENAINSLDDTIERALMGYKYIDGLTWEDVCVRIERSWTQTHRIHRNALKKIFTMA